MLAKQGVTPHHAAGINRFIEPLQKNDLCEKYGTHIRHVRGKDEKQGLAYDIEHLKEWNKKRLVRNMYTVQKTRKISR